MKKSMLAFLLLSAAICNGQSTLRDTSTSMFLKSGQFSVSYGSRLNEYKTDTISVVLLICDTLHYTTYTPQFKNSFDRAGSATWVKAYAVREITITKAGGHQSGDYYWYNEKDEYHYKTVKYLDDLLNDFSKHVIVWMSQPTQ